MKHSTQPPVFAFLFLLIGLAQTVSSAQPARAPAPTWSAVEKAIEDGTPRSALALLAPLKESALQARNWGNAARAIAQQAQIEASLEGNRPEEAILRLTGSIQTAPVELHPVLHALLADWYWAYFQQNRWRFLPRSRTQVEPGADFTSWDLPRLFQEIGRLFDRALSADTALKLTPVSQFEGILSPGTPSDPQRPSLYDFIAFRALQFFSAGEQAGSAPENQIELSSDLPVLGGIPLFGSSEEFIVPVKTERQAEGPASERALWLYRDLTQFHLSDADPAARIEVDLHRLRWAKNATAGENRSAQYLKALDRLATRWPNHSSSSQILHAKARELMSLGQFLAADQTARQGALIHRSSAGSELCRALIAELEAPASTLAAERVWLADGASTPEALQVSYKNITHLWFRAYPLVWKPGETEPAELNEAGLDRLLKRAPAAAWDVELPATTNYTQQNVSLPGPTGLVPGRYLVVASHRRDFALKRLPLSSTQIWVSDLALIARAWPNRADGFVLNATSGEPIFGAQVEVWQPNAQWKFVLTDTLTTDTSGYFSLKPTHDGHPLHLVATFNGQRIDLTDSLNPSLGSPEQNRESVYLFTDRALYRPGQAVHYKGIGVRRHASLQNHQLTPGRTLRLQLFDPQGKSVSSAEHTCNDFGSFSGTFTAPISGLRGGYSIRLDGDSQDQTSFQVEEYKRPKFQVQLTAPKTASRLQETTTVTGSALAYTGAPVDGSKVTWRVVRAAQFPDWAPWRGGPGLEGASQEISHGTTSTKNDGTFLVEFVAKPDLKVPPSNYPIFIFTVYADVTDSAGETRSESFSIRVGYTALELSLDAPSWQTPAKPVELSIRAQSLDEEPQVAEGRLLVYALRHPAAVKRRPLRSQWAVFLPPPQGHHSLEPDLSDSRNWATGPELMALPFTTTAAGKLTQPLSMKAGLYRVILESRDRFGTPVRAQHDITVIDPGSQRFPLRLASYLDAPNWEVLPGASLLAVWGTGYDEGRAFVEWIHRGQRIQAYWTEPGRTQQRITLPITEDMRGGLTLRVTQQREGRSYLHTQAVTVPWDSQDLHFHWEHFSSKLQPGAKETWTLIIQPGTNRVTGVPFAQTSTELMATLYDASLDQLNPHGWRTGLDLFPLDHAYSPTVEANRLLGFQGLSGQWPSTKHPSLHYRGYAKGLQRASRGSDIYPRGGMSRFASVLPGAAPAMAAAGAAPGAVTEDHVLALSPKSTPQAGEVVARGGGPDQSRRPNDPAQKAAPFIQARKSLRETAFFLPHLLSDTNGRVRLSFTMPESVTRWRFLAFGHDRLLRSGSLEANTVTAKDLMVQPNPPRFVREGDRVEFTVKVTNASDRRQSGRAQLRFQTLEDGRLADDALANTSPEQGFDLAANTSQTLSWSIRVPDGMGFLSYKAVASTEALSDGEEGPLPVLSRRVLLTESLPLPMRGPGVRQFQFTNLIRSANSPTLKHQSLTLQMVSQPAWYAVMALPYLMEFPHECAEQTFNRYYANALAEQVARSDPKIRRIFDLWKNTPALKSPLEANADLKAVSLEETPWLLTGQSEGQTRRNLGTLFDGARLSAEQTATLQKLQGLQLNTGLWPWFPGGPPNTYISLYIATGFGRLRHLGVDVALPQISSVWQALDQWAAGEKQRALKEKGDSNHLSHSIALYLYGRSFFLKDIPLSPEAQQSVEYWLKQARKHWLQLGSRECEAQLALALKRWGDTTTPKSIVNSLRERSLHSEEMGMFWRDADQGWWWHQAPIESQAMMVEVFDEVAKDSEAVEACKVWLLKQKQTQAWKTTRATADAVFALLLRGNGLLSNEALVEVDLAGKSIRSFAATPSKPEPGTGFYQIRMAGNEIRPSQGAITVTKTDNGVSWGSLHWQYFEDLANVKPHESTPLRIKKSLFSRELTAAGPVLRPLAVDEPLKVGDELVVRMELRVDRDLEFVHLKDQRGSGTEPVNVLSGYRWQDGLGYYESTRDTASHFFIDQLRRGTYVFEHSSRIQLRGEYQSGVAEIQCLYAPEFNSHSGSVTIRVK